MSKNFFEKWPQYSDDEVKVASDVLRSGNVNYWTGSQVKTFEREFSKWCGVEYSIALSNGTVAIELALKALEVRTGDHQYSDLRTFVASASSILNVGCVPIFADVCPKSENITMTSIKKVMNERVVGIICVHLGDGLVIWILFLSLLKNILFILEDCAQAHGASYKGRRVGSIGDVGIWSFWSR